MHEVSCRRKIIYYPPSKEVIETYVQKVCKVFDQKLGAKYGDKEMQEGMTTFMKLVVKAKVKHLNGEVNQEEKTT